MASNEVINLDEMYRGCVDALMVFCINVHECNESGMFITHHRV